MVKVRDEGHIQNKAIYVVLRCACYFRLIEEKRERFSCTLQREKIEFQERIYNLHVLGSFPPSLGLL